MFYFFSYSSFLARKTLYLEDIYITEQYRKLGVGKIFMNKLIQIAGKQKCKRIEWCVLKWNKEAIKFYEKFGANILSEWIYYRYEL